MRKAVNVYEELVDAFEYTASNWLHFDLAEATKNDGIVIAAASAFLFDNLFAKENAGTDLTNCARAAIGADFDPKSLANMATKLRLAMTGNDFAMGSSPLRDYIKWVSSAEPAALEAYKDDLGKLALVTIEEMVNLFLAENDAHDAPLRVAETYFLTITDTYARLFLELYGKEKLRAFASSPYFLSVREEMERIRAELND